VHIYKAARRILSEGFLLVLKLITTFKEIVNGRLEYD